MNKVNGSLAVALAIAVAACGGSVTSNGPGTDAGPPSSGDSGAGGSDSSTPHDGGAVTDSGPGSPTDSGVGQTDSGGGLSDAGFPTGDAGGGPTPCPATAPAGGSTCSQAGLECEYGTNPNQQCNSLFTCTGGTWEEQGGTGGSCAMGTCPATYASVPMTGACAPQNLECSYPQGTCLCTLGGGERVGGPEWSCIAATAACPSPRPDIGSACSGEGTECDYGACSGGIAISCTGGTWQQDEMIACPASR